MIEKIDVTGWDYEIDGSGLDWEIKWPLPMGLTMTAHVSFSEIAYIKASKEYGEAWGRNYAEVVPGYAEACGGEITRIDVAGNTITWPDDVKSAVIAIVTKYVEAMKTEDA